ncbi:hypothetical protein [Vibrio campbellii]|uniref:hypothetical protein n=1 Tax=Vibrio campbellii TaxID=680 RepID=UPI0005EE8117|nr:hypothetical protein [Vibrio campbellii]
MTNRPNLTNALDRAQAELGDLYYDPKQDKRRRGFDDTRTPNLTMKHLNKLNKLKKAKAIEAEAKSRLVRAMYGQDTEKTDTFTDTYEVGGVEPPKRTIEREYERVVEQWNSQSPWLLEEYQPKKITRAEVFDLKKQYEQGATLSLTGLFYKLSEDSEPIFTDEDDLAASVTVLQKDINGEIDGDLTPNYASIDHASNGGVFPDLKSAFGEITNVYEDGDEIYGEITLLPDNPLARQVIDLATVNNGLVSVSITFYEDDDGEKILVGCDVVSEPAIRSAQVTLGLKQKQQTKSIDVDELERVLDLAAVPRTEKLRESVQVQNW